MYAQLKPTAVGARIYEVYCHTQLDVWNKRELEHVNDHTPAILECAKLTQADLQAT